MPGCMTQMSACRLPAMRALFISGFVWSIGDGGSLRSETNALIRINSVVLAIHISLKPMAAIALRDKLVAPRRRG